MQKVNIDSNKENIKTELKVNETVKIVENKEEIKNSQNPEKAQIISNKEETKPTVNIESEKMQKVNIDSNKENIKTELKVNETVKIVENKEEIKNSQNPEKAQIISNKEETKPTTTVESEINKQVNIDSEITNTKLGKDLASLNKENILNEKISISKEEPKSLMDSLIDKTKTLKNQISLNDEETKTLKNTNTINNSKDVISNIYLSSQKNNINNSALSNKTEAINSVKNATTTEEVEVNAKKLDLNLKDISLETKAAEVKKDTINLIDRKNSLDKIILNNNARHNEVTNLITKSVEASKVIMDDTIDIENEVSLTVNPVLAQNIQTKIIGARQQMSSMMSEVAKQMYENYKPPVTAFRINLTPGALGNIAIVMKNDKDSGLNISLNISNTSTLDAFVDSQNSLRNALNKTFEEGTEFNLDFSSSEQNNNKSDEKEDTNHAFSNQSDTQSILESREKNLESEDRNLDYM